jgi:hypothetical protein
MRSSFQSMLSDKSGYFFFTSEKTLRLGLYQIHPLPNWDTQDLHSLLSTILSAIKLPNVPLSVFQKTSKVFFSGNHIVIVDQTLDALNTQLRHAETNRGIYPPHSGLLLKDICRPAQWVGAFKNRRALSKPSELVRPQ